MGLNKKCLIQWDETNGFSMITEAYRSAWADAYPDIDIAACLKRMHAWLLSNQDRRYVKWDRFINSWLAREQTCIELQRKSDATRIRKNNCQYEHAVKSKSKNV